MKKISHRLGMLLGVCLIGVGALGLYSVFALRNTSGAIRAAESKARVEGAIYNQIVQSKDVVADVLPPPGYVIEAYLVAIQLSEAESAADVERLRATLVRLESEYNARLNHWRATLPEGKLRNAYIASAEPGARFFRVIHQELLPAVASRDRTRARELTRTSLLKEYNNQRATVDKVVEHAAAQDAAASNELKHVLQTSEVEVGRVLRTATFRTVTCIALLVLGVAFSGMRLSSHITSELKLVASNMNHAAGEVVFAAEQVSTSSQKLAEGSGQQAASIEEAGASLEEMTSMTSRNAENARRANHLAKETRVAADKGVTDMAEMNTAMEAIKRSGSDIGEIIKTINEIAFQTNILALNAAVEAARAGDAGMGFAVVADEVRNLAQRSAQAARETSDKIEAAITNTAQGAEISGKVAQTLQEIVVKARQVDELAAEVASASRSQADGITQINAAINQMDKVTQTNAASAEESAAAAEQLNAQAHCMNETVADLMRIVVGPVTSGSATAASPQSANRTAFSSRRTSAPVPEPAPRWAEERSSSARVCNV